MIAAVVPVRNEEKRLNRALANLLDIPVDLIIPVVNGCTDQSYDIIKKLESRRLHPVYFREPLGLDIPRAVGAITALGKEARVVLFMDGDMDGEIAGNLCELIDEVDKRGVDMALTDCYPVEQKTLLSSLASKVLEMRRSLNQAAGQYGLVGAASPSHGPHAVSRRLLLAVPLAELAVPPVPLALAAKKNYIIRLGTIIPHHKLGSPEKDQRHAERIAATIIGDCLEAMSVFKGGQRCRCHNSREYDGYNSQRRWDLLLRFMKQQPKK